MPEPAAESRPVPDQGPKVPVGVLGAGRMGLPIVGHLARNGFPVSVYDPVRRCAWVDIATEPLERWD